MQRLWESCVLSDEFIYFSKQNNEACEQLDFVIGSALYQSRWEIRINMTNGSELQVVESAKRINYHLPPASRMVISSHCLICDGQHCVCHSSYQTNHKPHLGSIWSIHPVFQVRSHFMFVCSPYYFLWLSKISITLDSGTENGLWTPKAYILFIFFVMASLFPYAWVFPKILWCFFSPFSFFSIIFFGLPICGVQLHGSDPMLGFGLCSSEQQRTPRLLDFIDNINPLPSPWEKELSVGGFFFFFPGKDVKI